MENNQKKSPLFNSNDIPWIVEDAEYLDNYRVKVWFRDGSVKIVDFEKRLSGELCTGVFVPLKDLKMFSQVRFDEEASTICWPNGVDIAPEYLYENGIEIEESNQKMRA